MARFEHDCDGCIPLGKSGKADLYFCTQGGRMPTVIARFSDDEPDYTSGLAFALQQEREGRTEDPLVVALKMARERGLVP